MSTKVSLLYYCTTITRCTIACSEPCQLSQWTPWSSCQADSCYSELSSPVKGINLLGCEEREHYEMMTFPILRRIPDENPLNGE